MAHTPGPWSIVPDRDPLYLNAGPARLVRLPNVEADAALIAAAPDMLEALRKLVSHLDTAFEGEESAADAYGVTEDLAAARAVIAKIEGRK